MSALYMVSQSLDLRTFRRWCASRGLAADEGRALHHLLSETFGKRALQPFRLLVAPEAKTATLYAYSRSNEKVLRQTARETGTPDVLEICDPAQLAVKAMPDSWAEGRRLAFDIRVRPVRRLLRPAGAFAKGAEVDAFLAEALHRSPKGPPDDVEARLRRDELYTQWLGERLKGAAHLERARMVRFERNRIARDRGLSEGPDATFHGELSITNSDGFAQRLIRGVGRHVAYGYGMLLLRPAGG
ncbi:type I-E CRISPR-associated protein Cas6/Cse3/CasE [soil metagenome]